MKKIPVVILPGWMLGHTRFDPLRLAFEKSGFKTYVIDFPGFEEGEKILKAWSLSDYVFYLKKFLKQHKITKAIFVCHSFGGRVALKLLATDPDLAHALILSGTPGYRSTQTQKLFFIAMIAKAGHFALSIPPLSLFMGGAQKVFHLLVGARDISQLKGFMKQTFINIVEEDLEEYMKKIKAPTLLIWGGNDGLVSVSIAQRMRETIKNAKLTVLPTRRHNFLYKEAEYFTKEIVNFLKSIS